MNNVRDVFEPKRYAYEIWRHAAFQFLLIGYLLMRCTPGVYDECFCVADVGEVRA
jgi:hypothetical protein